jgi:farnesyl diphosphate synthase
MNSFNFNHWATQHQSAVEQLLVNNLPSERELPHTLHQAMRYAVLGGGKRIRTLFTYASAELCQAPVGYADAPAMAIELIHAFSLVHDDMPCMDDDDLRRGKPSTHKQYDDATALLTGDALQSLAFELIADSKCPLSESQKVKILHLLSVATGSRGMAGGQSIDLESTGITLNHENLEKMHAYKTGALIHAAAIMGVICAPNYTHAQYEAIDVYSKKLGLAFQVVDDILDAEADTETLGKTAGKDAENNKSTYVTLLGLAQAKHLAAELHQQAVNAIASFDERANPLRGLANLVVQRGY